MNVMQAIAVGEKGTRPSKVATSAPIDVVCYQPRMKLGVLRMDYNLLLLLTSLSCVCVVLLSMMSQFNHVRTF